jgi:molybdopterin synthase sulfur carrier subunit
MHLQLRYFARLRERFGTDAEVFEAELPGATVAGLIAALASRGGVWAEELAVGRPYRVAVGQQLVTVDAGLAEGDEVAIFPPVTGG